MRAAVAGIISATPRSAAWNTTRVIMTTGKARRFPKNRYRSAPAQMSSAALTMSSPTISGPKSGW